jgi:hypothetical protein
MKNCSGNSFFRGLSGAVMGKNALKFRCILLMFLITIVTCSIYIISFHYHDGPVIRTDCPTCKFMAVLSSGEEAAAPQPVIPDFAHLFIHLENLICIFAVITLVLGTRAPPLYNPHLI